MSRELLAFEVLALLLITLGVFGCVLALAHDPSSLPLRYTAKYTGYLDRKLYRLFLPARGRAILWGQALAGAAVVAGTLLSRAPALYLLLLPVAFAPALYVEQLRRRRVSAVEARTDGFILALANALKATPSIGNALSYTQPLLAPPLDVEVALALKEMRLGNTVDQALLSMAARVQSPELDAALAGLLIGRQVGGDLPKILEKTAETLREMARLQGVVRSKTAEGKAQLIVLAVFPGVILILFDTVSRGYFDPLGQSIVGWTVVATAVALWVASLLMARKVLAVDV